MNFHFTNLVFELRNDHDSRTEGKNVSLEFLELCTASNMAVQEAVHSGALPKVAFCAFFWALHGLEHGRAAASVGSLGVLHGLEHGRAGGSVLLYTA